MDKQCVHVNGIDLAYKECGNIEGKAVVLLHGFCGSSQYWQQVCGLLGEKYRIIMPDLRGHGSSSSPAGTYTMELMADDIASLLDSLEIDRVVMFGHSMGGYVTAAFAEKYPERLSGFGLLHSTVLPDSEEMKEKRSKDIQTIREQGIGYYIHNLVPNLFAQKETEEHHSKKWEVAGIGHQMQAEAAIGILEGIRQRPDLSHVLTEACYPVLLVAGAEDGVVKPDDTFSITREEGPETTYKYPHILETTFEDVAHMSLVEVSEQLARVIATYLKTISEREQTRHKGHTEMPGDE